MKVFTRTGKVAAVGVVALFAVAGCTSAPTPSGTTTSGKYVALGDSFTANSFHSPGASSNGCDQTGRNQPHVVQARMGFSSFVDASCDGATSDDIMAAGTGNASQISFVTSTTKLVTLSIGGNDIGFSDIVKDCATKLPGSSGCQSQYVHDGRDELSGRIAATAPKVDAVLAEIKRKAPAAKTFVVGYPTVLPETGNGCYPLVPVLPSDVPYLRAKVKELNAMLAARAGAAGVTYVDIATPSIGHDFCQSGSAKWVEGIVPTSVAAPVHPNARGMAGWAPTVAAAVNAVVTS